jgi:hypothetical protein
VVGAAETPTRTRHLSNPNVFWDPATLRPWLSQTSMEPSSNDCLYKIAHRVTRHMGGIRPDLRARSGQICDVKPPTPREEGGRGADLLYFPGFTLLRVGRADHRSNTFVDRRVQPPLIAFASTNAGV